MREKDIAVIGVSLKLPEANNLTQYWSNLINGKESVKAFNDIDLVNSEVPKSKYSNSKYVKASAIIDDIEMFDAGFFGYNPKEAELMDPQFRHFLECSWEAIEDSGYNPDYFNGTIGVFASAYFSHYLIKNLNSYIQNKCQYENEIKFIYQNVNDFLATNVAYKLNLKGPSVNIQSWCTSSLSAVHYAIMSIRNNECDLALAGGVSFNIPQIGYLSDDEGMLSPDGHCKSFDSSANGSVDGNGLGVLVLKRLTTAIKDRDNIYAVIKGSAFTNDGGGKNKLSYHGSTVNGQCQAIEKALSDADSEADAIYYIEANGVASKLADRIELDAISKAYCNSKSSKIMNIGSVKPNIGHLSNASGISSLIKAILIVKHKEIPPTIHYTSLTKNKKKDSLCIVDRLLKIKSNSKPLRVGVNTYGIGGTNAHIILEEPPVIHKKETPNKYNLLTLSAKDENALNQTVNNLKNSLIKNENISISDAAYTQNIGRKAFAYRASFCCLTKEQAINELEQINNKQLFNKNNLVDKNKICFIFPGYGSERAKMAFDLYAEIPFFKKQFDKCVAFFKEKLNYNLLDIIYSNNEKDELIHNPVYALPALFSVEYSLAKLLIHWKIVPDAVVGYSIGEVTAATIADAMSLEDATTFISEQIKLLNEVSEGSMLSVPLSKEEVKKHLNHEIQLAAVNGPELCIVSGIKSAIKNLKLSLECEDIFCLELNSNYPFHSKLMLSIKDKLIEKIKHIKFYSPNIPIISCNDISPIEDQCLRSSEYWANKISQTVWFEDTMLSLFNDDKMIYLETGPGQILTQLIKSNNKKSSDSLALSCMPVNYGNHSSTKHLIENIGELWENGIDIDWSNYYSSKNYHRISLPTYAFQREKYWISPEHQYNNQSVDKNPNISDWFYTVNWKKNLVKFHNNFNNIKNKKGSWIIFYDNQIFIKTIVKILKQNNQKIILVKSGNTFNQKARNEFEINPLYIEDFQKLFTIIEKSGFEFERILHFLTFTEKHEKFNQYEYKCFLEKGFYTLNNVSKALGEISNIGKIEISIISNGTFKIDGTESIYPGKSVSLGPARVIPKEFKNISCNYIDVNSSDTQLFNNDKDLLDFIGCVYNMEGNKTIAYRNGEYWEQFIDKIDLNNCKEDLIKLKHKGTYLITGGIGGIGLVIAEYLIKAYNANLILTTRSDFPNKKEWYDLLNSNNLEKSIYEKISKLVKIESYGGQLIIVKADVTSRSDMEKILSNDINGATTIDGIFHLAGLPGGGLIQRRNKKEMEKVLAPKIKGTKVLIEVFKNVNLDFIVFGSSITSVVGSVGQVDYCAANAYMDAISTMEFENCKYVGSINWSMWSEVNMNANSDLPKNIKDLYKYEIRNGISNKEGIQALRHILLSSHPQVIVYPRDLLNKEVYDTIGTFNKIGTIDKSENHKRNIRKRISAEYVEASSELEKKLVEWWESLLGVHPIGINDNFLELGGHSLIAVTLMNKIHNEYNINLSLQHIFDYPTILSFAQLVQKELSGNRTYHDNGLKKEQLLQKSLLEQEDEVLFYLKRKLLSESEFINNNYTELEIISNLDNKEIAEISWHIKRDFDVLIFLHEFKQFKSLTDISKIIVNTINNKFQVSTNENYDKYLEWIPEVNWNSLPSEPISSPICFILSAQRSGSTLLRIMLDGHSKLYCPPELGLLPFNYMQEWDKNLISPISREGLIITLSDLMNYSKSEAEEYINQLIAKKTSSTEVFRLIQKLIGKKIIVEKTPNNTFKKDLLLKAERAFENPKYILLIRHPYSVIESFAKNRFDQARKSNTEFNPYQLGEFLWYTCNNNMIEFSNSINNNRAMIVIYEELVNRPKEILNDICSFLEVGFEEQILNPYDGNRSIIGPGDPNFFLYDKINPEIGNKWRNIKLPYKLNCDTIRLATYFKYDLPNESEMFESTTEITGSLSEEYFKENQKKFDDLSQGDLDKLLKIK